MNVCPWCKAKNPPRAEVCLTCGKRPGEHPSLSGGNNVDTSLDSDRPPPMLDLELNVPAPQRKVSAHLTPAVGGSSSKKAESTGYGQVGGSDQNLDDWDNDGADAPILDLAPREVLERPSAKMALNKGGEKNQVKASPEEIEAQEVRQLANYGPIPEKIWLTPMYAVKVKLRQRELRQLLAVARKSLGELEAKRDERYGDLGSMMRPLAEKSAALAAIVKAIQAAEQSRTNRAEAMASASASFRDQAAAIDRDVASLEAPTAAQKRDVDTKQTAFSHADDLRAKAEQRTKAVDVELKAAQARFESPQTPSAEKGAIYASMASMANDRDARLAEEQEATKVAQSKQADLAESKRKLAELDERAGGLRKRRADLEKEFARQGQARNEGIQAASREVKQAFIELGRRVFPSKVEVPGSDVARKAIVDAENQVKRAQRDLERHLRALDAADASSVKQGLMIISAVLGLIVLIFLIWWMTRPNAYVDPSGRPRPPS